MKPKKLRGQSGEGVAVEYLKWCSVDGGMETGVVPELRQRYPLNPLPGAGVNEAA
jgi:hypothetical protein